MDWISEVQKKQKRNHQILFSKDSSLLQELSMLLEVQNHRAVVLWALEFAEKAADELQKRYPNEKRPGYAVLMAKKWAAGEEKMRPVQRAILDCHGVAKEFSNSADAAMCHAIGHACGTVHTAGHALGYPMYELTAIVRNFGLEAGKDVLEKRVDEYIRCLLFWSEYEKEYAGPWAGFMLRD